MASDWTTVRAGGAAFVAFASCVLAAPRVISWLKAKRIREDITKKDSKRLTEIHSVKKDTPTMGGLFMIGSALFASVATSDLTNPFVLTSLAAIAVLGAVGYADDWIKLHHPKKHGMAGKPKLLFQAAVGLGVGFVLWKLGHPTLVRVPLTGLAVNFGAAYPAFAMLVVVATSNAVNLTDGLDGLASGCFVASCLAYALILAVAGRPDFAAHLGIPWVKGAGELLVLCGALVGAVLGFMWFNVHPAQVFMGNTGSLPLGGALAVLALVSKQEIALLVIGGVFVMEALSVIIQVVSFKTRGTRVFKIAPIHHHFQFEGWHENTITARFWILSAISALAGLAVMKAG